VFPTPYRPRLFDLGLVTLISGASIVNCASAEFEGTSFATTRPTSSLVVVANRLTADGKPEATPPTLAAAPAAGGAVQAPMFGRIPANSSGPISRPAGLGDRTSLEMIAPQAQAHIDYALNLAERGAVQSAQAEFIMAMDLIGDALDADTHSATRAHARAVQAGLTAIKETKDFMPADTPLNIEINLTQLASTHQTPALRNVDASRITRAEALQRYHTYATEQLAFAGGHSAIASSALYGLGRVESLTTAGANTRNPLGAPNAMALFQAAILVDPRNYMASNELGVLMARFGDLDGAAEQLTHSLSIKPQVETWHNLATVYRRMGKPEMAAQAEQEREKLLAAAHNRSNVENSTDSGTRPTVQWVDVDTFAASTTPYGLDGPAVNSNKSATIGQRKSLPKRLIAKLMPWSKEEMPQASSELSPVNQKTDPSRSAAQDGRALFK
jgi:tetratricopeptide (TPR) repeat protein